MTAPVHPQSAASLPFNMAFAVALLVVLFAGIVFAAFLLRKFMRDQARANKESWTTAKTDVENPSAFMAASMQGVIEKLRTQEKELARLHSLAQERAQESERLTEEVTRNMPTGLLLVNATGAISSTNPAAEEALGIPTLRYRSYKEILGAESELTQMLTACIRDGKTFQRGEVEHFTTSGEVRHLGVTISPVYRSIRNVPRSSEESPPQAAVMKVSGALCLMSDLTELTALQKRIRWKENLAALGEMSAGIAHEFKNALATISGYAQMISAEAGVGEVADSAKRILEQTRSITHVVTEFLKYARPLEITNEPVALEGVVERVVSEVAEAMPQVRIRFEGSMGSVAGDEGLLRQAFLNLARNAAEASVGAANGGRVLLRGEVVRHEETYTQRVTVFDNGAGIAPATLLKLFRPFFTTKAKGTGLGLAVVQKIIVQHGGRVEARNRTEGGAAFIVTLPACRSVPEAVELKKHSI